MNAKKCRSGGKSAVFLPVLALLLTVVSATHGQDEKGADSEPSPPFKLKVILSEHHDKLDDGTIRLTRMTLDKLVALKEEFVRSKQPENVEFAEKAIAALKFRIEKIRKDQEKRRGFESGASSTNHLKDMISEGKWMRAGNRPGIPRTLYTLKPDGSAEGFIINARGNPTLRVGWVAWELKGDTLRVGPKLGGGETFTWDPEKKVFSGPLSNLSRKKEEDAPGDQ